MDSSLNSSKSNNLPEWEKYFPLFADRQYMMFQCVQECEKIKAIFKNCQRDNLVMPWSIEELYVVGCERDKFTSILEKNLCSVYESARMQGYRAWGCEK